jgi:uncharacterized membrane protein YsdA (DUF1294 family)
MILLVVGLLVIVLALADVIPLPPELARILGGNRDLAMVVSAGLLLMVILWAGVERVSRVNGFATKVMANLAVFFSIVVVLTGAVAMVVLASPGVRLTMTDPPLVVPWPLAIYGIVSAVTFVLYGYDKGMARRNEWRVPEAVLHFIELLGGWPGATIARGIFRHKCGRRKANFRAVTWFIALTHIVFWVSWAFWWR